MFTILWKRKAQKQLLKISKTEIKEAIATAIEKLTQFPNIQQAKALTNHQYGYRLRVGNYRVLFDVDTTVQIIAIEEVKKRDDNTY
jgi:mRNA-degrading endonuclease RelE of RelBE toxin-antitoxin system